MMKLAITDPLAEAMGLYVQETAPEYLIVRTDSETAFFNAYGFAHGGFLYTIGHVAARNMGLMCLDRHMQVVQSDCLYLSKVLVGPVSARAEVLSDYGHSVVCLVEVSDGEGNVCFRQTLTLQDTTPDHIVTQQPKQPDDQARRWVKKSSSLCLHHQDELYFDEICHVFPPEHFGENITFKTDLYTDNCSDAGVVHQGAIYTCCDNCAAACVASMQHKRPITIASTIHYLAPAAIGPVVAQGKLIREGHLMSFYQIDAFDGYGRPVATTQFVMRCQKVPQIN